jgi:hypothetical protein
MPLEFAQEAHGLNIRVDGDVVEIFSRGTWSHRVPLAWLAVKVMPSTRGHLSVEMSSAEGPDVPLYQQLPKYWTTVGVSTFSLTIAIEEEPIFRQFFTELAQLCGRQVVLLTGR